MIPHSCGLEPGAKAPAFSLQDQEGNTHTLADYKGKKLILFFYPADNTPTCTVEVCNLRDAYETLREQGFALLGVSPDSQKKHQNFIKKHELPFPLIPDTEKTLIKAYDVWGPKKFMGREYEGLIRTTFVINEKGIIERVFHKVKSKIHAEQILESYQSE